MTRLRSLLVLGVVVTGVVGAVATLFVVDRDPAAAFWSVFAVQAATVTALAITIWVLLGPTVGRLDELIEALRAFARGERQTRVHPADFAGLADVARAVNDVGASLCENDDPNLGPVIKKPRDKPVRRPGSDAPRPSAGSGPVKRSPYPEGDAVGEVRKHSGSKPTATPAPETAAAPPPAPSSPAPPSPAVARPAAAAESFVEGATDSTVPTEAPRPVIGGEGVSEPRVSRKQRRKAKKAAAASTLPTPAGDATTPPQPAIRADDGDDDDTGTDGATISGEDASLSGEGQAEVSADAVSADADGETPATTEAPATIIESAPPASVALPNRAELQALFDEFRREKRGSGQGDDVDVDFDAFADTILAESERLISEHQCRGVRFEVAVAEGEVSLRPRLIR